MFSTCNEFAIITMGHSQETKAEYAHQHDLLLLGQLKVLDHRQWHAEDDKVRDQVDRRHDIPDGELVEAFAGDVWVPEIRDRIADQRQQDREGDRPGALEDESGHGELLHD